MNKYNFEQTRNDYMTPEEVYKPLLVEAGREYFDMDVCCTTNNIPAFYYATESGITTFDKELDARLTFASLDGLNCNWGLVNWMNCPFDKSRIWIMKAYEQQQEGKTTYAILPVRTETKYWHDYILNNPNCEIRYQIKGIRFIDPETMEQMGVFKNALAIVIFHGVKENNSHKQLRMVG